MTPAGWAQADEFAQPRRVVSLLRRLQPGRRVSGGGMKRIRMAAIGPNRSH